MSVQCPVYARSWRTAYNNRRCRCDTCVAESRAHSARQRAARKAMAAEVPGEIDPSMHAGLEALWIKFMEAFMADLNYAADMMEASVPIADRRGER